MQIDERFLSVHPATLDWWDQREKCESCRHLNLREGRDGEGIMLCTRVIVDRRSTRDIRGMYCIDARSPDGACGPWASLWEEK